MHRPGDVRTEASSANVNSTRRDKVAETDKYSDADADADAEANASVNSIDSPKISDETLGTTDRLGASDPISSVITNDDDDMNKTEVIGGGDISGDITNISGADLRSLDDVNINHDDSNHEGNVSTSTALLASTEYMAPMDYLHNSSVDGFVIYSDSDGASVDDGLRVSPVPLRSRSSRRTDSPDILPHNSSGTASIDAVMGTHLSGEASGIDSLLLSPATSLSPESTSTKSRSRSRSRSRSKSEKNIDPDLEGGPKRRSSRARRKSAGSGSSSMEGSPRPKRKSRRKSTKSDAGSSMYQFGSGYTSTPATGKIFRNLLILEENLRQLVIQQRALRRKYLTFLAILCSLITSLSHILYFSAPDATVRGPLRVLLQLILLALLMTILLYHLSGEYQKTIVLPRKFLLSSNKGLRQLNVRLVKIKTPWSDAFVDTVREVGLFITTMCLKSVHKVYPLTRNNRNSKLEVFLVSCMLKCQPRLGITDVKLMLNARVFKTHVREGWELYRSEFWIQEGVRRRKQMLAFIEEDDKTSPEKKSAISKEKRERKERKKSPAKTPANELVMS